MLLFSVHHVHPWMDKFSLSFSGGFGERLDSSSDVRSFGRIHDADDIRPLRIATCANGYAQFRVFGGTNLDFILKLRVRNRPLVQVKEWLLFRDGYDQAGRADAFLRLLRFGQGEFNGRSLFEGCCDHQKNQKNDQDIDKRYDDYGRGLVTFAGDEMHGSRFLGLAIMDTQESFAKGFHFDCEHFHFFGVVAPSDQ